MMMHKKGGWRWTWKRKWWWRKKWLPRPGPLKTLVVGYCAAIGGQQQHWQHLHEKQQQLPPGGQHPWTPLQAPNVHSSLIIPFLIASMLFLHFSVYFSCIWTIFTPYIQDPSWGCSLEFKTGCPDVTQLHWGFELPRPDSWLPWLQALTHCSLLVLCYFFHLSSSVFLHRYNDLIHVLPLYTLVRSSPSLISFMLFLYICPFLTLYNIVLSLLLSYLHHLVACNYLTTCLPSTLSVFPSIILTTDFLRVSTYPDLIVFFFFFFLFQLILSSITHPSTVR